ncbi:MAG: DUF5685 family protein [Firmicutes bacterium]|nr:DUF5685 family protein [Bacillota bacterium]
MYGYLVPDKPNLYMKDFVLFRAFYCGLCKTTARKYGQLPRFLTNYDAAVWSLFFHSYYNRRPEFEDRACVLNPFKKKTIAAPNAISDKVCALNMLYSYHKLTDDMLDGRKGRRAARRVIRRRYRAARAEYPEACRILEQSLEDLRKLEQGGEASPERAADAFSEGFSAAAAAVFDEQNNGTLKAFLNAAAKYIYLIDALDDMTEDYKSGNYNSFLQMTNDRSQMTDDKYNAQCSMHNDGLVISSQTNEPNLSSDNHSTFNKKAFAEANKERLDFLFGSVFGSVEQSYTALELIEGRDLLDNIFLRGIRKKYAEAFSADKKLKKERL